MSFLAPLFLAGGLAIAAPIIFHLIRQTTRDRKIFSSLMFLRPSPPRLTRRSRLEHLLLLLLRCAALALLCAGFARPFLKQAVPSPNATTSRRLVLLVDTSASMKRRGIWPEAQRRLDQFLRGTSELDQVSVMTFDQATRTVVSFDQWNATAIADRAAMALSRMKEIAPGWGGTQLGRALISAAEALAEETGRPGTGRQIVLFSDLQEGSRLESLQGYEWPKEIRLVVESLLPVNKGNAGLQLVADAEDADNNDAAVSRVRIINSSDSAREQFKVGWAGNAGAGFISPPADVYVPAGQSRVLLLSVPTNQNPHRILLQGDDEDFDNSVFQVPPETSRQKVLYLGGESETDPAQPLYFLQRAFQVTRRESVLVQARAPSSPIAAADIQDASLLIASQAMPAESVRELREQVMKGRTVLFLIRNEGVAGSLGAVLEIDKPAISEIRPKDYAMLGEIDFSHPLFAAFADARFNDFTRIHFWKYWRLDPATIPNARVLARFDSRDPALLEIPLGKGRVMALCAGWQPEESQLALSTKFVPLLYALLDLSSPVAAVPTQYLIGDKLPLGTNATSRIVRLPDGAEIKFAGSETNFIGTTMPGIYSIVSEQPGRTSIFAVNLEAAESRTAPLAADQLETLGAPMQSTPQIAAVANAKVRLQNYELEGRQKLWRWFLLATLLVILIETWLAGRTARVAPASVQGESAQRT